LDVYVYPAGDTAVYPGLPFTWQRRRHTDDRHLCGMLRITYRAVPWPGGDLAAVLGVRCH